MWRTISEQSGYLKYLLFRRWIVRDELTGLLNRRKWWRDLDAVLRKASQVTFILADMDQFGVVNRTYGPGVGDQVLRTISRRLEARCASMPAALGPYRFGGEAFAVVLKDAGAEEAVAFAELLRADVEEMRMEFYPELRVTARFAAVTASIKGHKDADRHRYDFFLNGMAHDIVYCHPNKKTPNTVVGAVCE
jgi:diguanylate cyclase (GGDEF)-like protein